MSLKIKINKWLYKNSYLLRSNNKNMMFGIILFFIDSQNVEKASKQISLFVKIKQFWLNLRKIDLN